MCCLPNHETRRTSSRRQAWRPITSIKSFRLTGLIGRIPRVVRGELDDVIGDLVPHLVENAAGYKRCGHRLRRNFIRPHLLLHGRANLLRNITADRQIELQGQRRLLAHQLRHVFFCVAVSPVKVKPNEQKPQPRNGQQESRCHAFRLVAPLRPAGTTRCRCPRASSPHLPAFVFGWSP